MLFWGKNDILEGITKKNAIVIDMKVNCPLTNRFDLVSVVNKFVFLRILVDFFLTLKNSYFKL